ncbi:MAG: glycogen synthase GlgA [Clostridiales bacterium]|nr:glycogen synthase GlgA [Clostridiales bacterium]
MFVCSEAFPFAGTGGLGEVMGSLPRAVNEQKGGFEARVILPLYESFPDSERSRLQFMCHINVPLAWRNQYCGLFKLVEKGVTYYFVDNEYYFKRPNLYGYYDDGERFAFFSRAVVELIPHLDFKLDVLHCHDWQTALVPIYYKLFYMYREGYGGIKTIFTIHNIEYQGKYSRSIIEDVFGIPAAEYMSIEHRGCINLMKGAIDYSDAISTVSPTYARQIMDPYYAHGLENVLLKNSHKLRGILNGIDVDTYNPRTQKALFANYDENHLEGKARGKAELQRMLNLPVSPDTPIIAIVSRLVSHKGLDLIRYAMNDILRKNVQVVLLGKGDPDYENYFSHVQKMYDQKFSAVIAFNKDLSHKIYAGADIFLMPSKSEPCGLSQMMACRYGTIPVVRETGGLNDSIVDCYNGDLGNGFRFSRYDAADMLGAIDRAVGLYADYKDKWHGLVVRAMTSDFTWKTSAGEYLKFYKDLY